MPKKICISTYCSFGVFIAHKNSPFCGHCTAPGRATEADSLRMEPLNSPDHLHVLDCEGHSGHIAPCRHGMLHHLLRNGYWVRSMTRAAGVYGSGVWHSWWSWETPRRSSRSGLWKTLPFFNLWKGDVCFGGEGKASCLENVICKFGLFMTYHLILVQIRYKDISEALAVMWFCTFFGREIMKCMFGNMTCRARDGSKTCWLDV